MSDVPDETGGHPTRSPHIRKGREAFHVAGETAGFALRDYWRWSGSDLLSNLQRGVMAEFLVARALGTATEPRREWGSFAVRTREGHGVAVKSAAYWQSWQQPEPSVIQFDIAPRRWSWDPVTNETETYEPPRRSAKAYVFCLLGSRADQNPDPLDIDQWRFLVLPTSRLDAERPEQKTISLNPLLTLKPRDVSYTDLRQAIEAVIRPGV